MKKEYTVFVSQLVFYKKTIFAESAEQAEKISFDDSNYGCGWNDYAYGDWHIEEVREVQP